MVYFEPENVFITGSGFCAGTHRVTNELLSSAYNAPVMESLGVNARYFLSDEAGLSDMAVTAAENALTDAKLEKTAIDRIILATTTQEFITPSTASIIQNKLGLRHVPCFDMNAACTGFMAAMDVALRFLATTDETILVIGADCRSRTLDFSDHKTSGIYGDGAGAFVLSSKHPSDFAINAGFSLTDVSYPEAVTAYAIGHSSFCKEPQSRTRINDTSAIVKQAWKGIKAMTRSFDEKFGLKAQDIDKFLFHQPNPRLLDLFQRKLDLPEGKLLKSCDEYANTVTASIPLTFHLAKTNNDINAKDKLALIAIGAGMSAYGMLINVK